jgi:hypothetical protein
METQFGDRFTDGDPSGGPLLRLGRQRELVHPPSRAICPRVSRPPKDWLSLQATPRGPRRRRDGVGVPDVASSRAGSLVVPDPPEIPKFAVALSLCPASSALTLLAAALHRSFSAEESMNIFYIIGVVVVVLVVLGYLGLR